MICRRFFHFDFGFWVLWSVYQNGLVAFNCGAKKKDKKRIGSRLYQKLGFSIKIEDLPGALN